MILGLAEQLAHVVLTVINVVLVLLLKAMMMELTQLGFVPALMAALRVHFVRLLILAHQQPHAPLAVINVVLTLAVILVEHAWGRLFAIRILA